jgi:hypothetical protein
MKDRPRILFGGDSGALGTGCRKNQASRIVERMNLGQNLLF